MDERYGRRYEDDERRFTDPAAREYEYEGRPGSYGDRGRRERGFLDRAGDEVRSWFGDEDAEQRRRADERRARARGRSSAPRTVEREGWSWSSRDEGERRASHASPDMDEREWARPGGYVDDRSQGRRMSGIRSGAERWDESVAGGRSPRADYWVTGGPYAGRGPKGYRRSDERIREDVCDLLCEHGALDASNVEVQVVAGEVTLIGLIATRPQKRLAEDLADSVSGVNEVHNQLRLSSQPMAPPAASAAPPAPPLSQDWRNRAA